MNTLLLNLLLALVWVSLTGVFSPANLLLGFVLAYLLLWFGQYAAGPSRYFRKLQRWIVLLLVVAWELVRANLRVAFDVVTPTHYMHPGVVAIPLDVQSPAEITLLSNIITLTPGSLTIDLSPDRRVLYVHGMYVRDPEGFRRAIKDNFERRIRELFA